MRWLIAFRRRLGLVTVASCASLLAAVPASPAAVPGWSGTVTTRVELGAGTTNHVLWQGSVRIGGPADDAGFQAFGWSSKYHQDVGPHSCPDGVSFSGYVVDGSHSGAAAVAPGQGAIVIVARQANGTYRVIVSSSSNEPTSDTLTNDCGAVSTTPPSPSGHLPTNLNVGQDPEAIATADPNNVRGHFHFGSEAEGTADYDLSLTRAPDADGDGFPDTGPKRDACPQTFAAPPSPDGCPSGTPPLPTPPPPPPPPPPTCKGPDRDADGIPNACDNCPTVKNSDQADADHDKRGDACDDPWDPLISIAAGELLTVNGRRLAGARGFFEQILNIVCGAARSPRPVCSDMAPAYAPTQWASNGVGCARHRSRPDCWVFNVFAGYLHEPEKRRPPETPNGVAATLEAHARAGARALCRQLRLGVVICDLFARRPEAQTLYAGIVHFNFALDPYFKKVTQTILRPRNKSRSGVSRALRAIRRQHNALVQFSVLPGFDRVFADGGLVGPAKTIAQKTVPFAAVCFRENAIYKTLLTSKYGFGPTAGRRYYNAATPPTARSTFRSTRCAALLALAALEKRKLPRP